MFSLKRKNQRQLLINTLKVWGFLYLFIVFFRDKVSLGSTGIPGIHFVDQGSLKHTERSACLCHSSAPPLPRSSFDPKLFSQCNNLHLQAALNGYSKKLVENNHVSSKVSTQYTFLSITKNQNKKDRQAFLFQAVTHQLPLHSHNPLFIQLRQL